MIKSILKYVGRFSSFGRVQSHIEKIEKAYNPTKAQLEQAAPLKSQLNNTIIKASLASLVRSFLYFIIYFGVITATIATLTTTIDLSFIKESVKIISSIVGGTAVILIFAFLFDRIKNLYMIDMMLLASNIASIYSSPENLRIDFKEFIEGKSLFFSKVRPRRSAKSK